MSSSVTEPFFLRASNKLEDFSFAKVLMTCSWLTGSVDVCQEMNNIQLQQLQTEEATRIRLNQNVNKLDHQVQHLTTVSLHVNQWNTCSASTECDIVFGESYPKQLLFSRHARIYFIYILGSYKWTGKARCHWDRAEYEEPGSSWQAERGPGRANWYVYQLNRNCVLWLT